MRSIFAVKALSIRQPWAWAIAHAGKDIENRNWHMGYRGVLAIHAAKGMTDNEYESFNFFFDNEIGERFVDENVRRYVPRKKELIRGAIIAVCRAIECCHEMKSAWYQGPHGLHLVDVFSLPEPISCNGKLGFFELPTNVCVKVFAQSTEWLKSHG